MKRFLGFVFIFYFGVAIGQKDATDMFPMMYYIIPPSPNASALGKYGDIPVSLYTGLPNIDIPIYSVSSGDIGIPISLSYHGGGVKVEERASHEGLGWTLNSGGAITRTVRGLPDESTSGFLNNGIDANAVLASDVNAKVDYYFRVGNNLIDLQPDIYNYNFCGKSGKFIIDRSTRKGFLINNDEKIDITWNDDNSWTITDINGSKYYFGSYQGNSAVERSIVTQNGRTGGAPLRFPSTWYLLAIRDTKNNSADFTYTSYHTTYCQLNQETKSWLNYAQPYPNTGCPNPAIKQSWNETDITGSKISSIVWRGGRISFNYSPDRRTDLNTDDNRLQSIIVSDDVSPNNQRLKFNLYHSYFGLVSGLTFTSCSPDGSTGRLRLDKIQQEDQSGSLLTPYLFTYNSGQLPSYNSMKQDHWGYYNGVNNSTLIPASRVTNGTDEMVLTGADRSPDIKYCESGTLGKIDYPTGGSTEFSYELHDSHMGDFDFEPLPGIPTIQYATVSKKAMVRIPESTMTFVINGKERGPGGKMGTHVTVITSINGSCDPGVRGSCNGIAYIQATNVTSSFIWSFKNAGNVSGSKSDYLFLENGSYKLALEGEGAIENLNILGCSVLGPDPSYYDAVGLYNKPIGGLRIKKIITNDGTGKKSAVNYVYRYEDQPTISSGVLVTAPVYGYTTSKQSNVSTGGGGAAINYCFFYTRTSNSQVQLGFTQGSHIGYEYVQEIKGEDATQFPVGKSTYLYSTAKNYGDYGTSDFPFGPGTSYDMKRGLLKESKQFSFNNGQFYLLKHTINKYTVADPRYSKSVWGIYMGNRGMGFDGTANDVVFRKYSDESLWVWLNETDVRDYSGGNSGIFSESFTKYSFDNLNHLLPTKIQTGNSKNELITTTIKYPLDFVNITASDGVSQGIKQLQSKNIINAQIEMSVYNSNSDGTANRLTSSKFAVYKSTSPLMDQVYIVESPGPLTNFVSASVVNGAVQKDSRYQLRASFTQYDLYGHLLEQQKANDIKEAYLWGYKSSYPVAKIIGSDYSTAQKFIVSPAIIDNANGQYTDQQMRDELNKIRIGLLSSKGQVSTFTYTPLVGITSQTDQNGKVIYYEYDGFNRLSLVRDQDKNILKKICYNYTGQPDACPLVLVTYSSGTQSGTFTRNNCPAGGTGGSVVYTISAGAYTSTISPGDANQQALNALNANGQAYANTNGSCTYASAVKSGTFIRNNCPAGSPVGSVTYTVNAGAYISTVSQADADQQAQNAVNTNGQTYANANGSCTYSSVAQSGTFTRNNCSAGGVGGSVVYTINAGTYTSTISPGDANQQALNALNANGQGYANTNGTCTFANAAKSGVFTRNNCTAGYTGSAVTYQVNAGAYTSTISKEDADQKAQAAVNANGQAYANTNGTCSSPNATIILSNPARVTNYRVVFTKNNVETQFPFPSSGTASVSIASGTYNVSFAPIGSPGTSRTFSISNTSGSKTGTSATFTNVVISGTVTLYIN